MKNDDNDYKGYHYVSSCWDDGTGTRINYSSEERAKEAYNRRITDEYKFMIYVQRGCDGKIIEHFTRGIAQ